MLTFFKEILQYYQYSIHSEQGKGGGGGISLTPHYHHDHPLHRHLDISWVTNAESSPLHTVSSRIQTGDLWFPSANR